MKIKPGLRRRSKAVGSPGEVDDVVCRGGLLRELRADLEYVVIFGCIEEGVPVLRLACKVMQPMADVGEHTIDVDHDHGGHHIKNVAASQQRQLITERGRRSSRRGVNPMCG